MSKESLIKLRDYIFYTLSYEDRMWLVDELRKFDDDEGLECPYTKEKLDARIAQAERDFENGDYISPEEFFQQLDKQFNLGWNRRHRKTA